MKSLLKPALLKAGDTVGIVSPSWGAAGLFPHRLERGVAQLEQMGFKTTIGAHARGVAGHVSATPAERVADLHAMFVDPAVKAIIAAIGGDHSNQMLPLIDFDLIRDNPTIFMGYSDVTVLNVALHVGAGLVTFNGPALITDFAEYPEMFAYTENAFRQTVMATEAVGPLAPAPWWTDEQLDWGQKLDLIRPRERHPSPGWQWLKPGQAEGPLVGGCFGSMEHLRGTRWWPNFDGTLLFLESSEDCSGPAELDARLMDYENMGVFDQINGLLIGRPYHFDDAAKAQLRQIILERTAAYAFPIVSDMDFGHTAPQFLLPLGVRGRIDSEAQTFSLLEAAVTG